MERTENRIRALRDSAAEAVLRRIRRDQDAAHPRFRELLATIEGRLFDPELKVSDLWKKTGIAPRYAHWFRELDPPTTPGGYIADRRLDTAAEMLIRDPDLLDIWRIAEAVCYAYPAFSVAFKKRFGVTPSEYRCRHGGAGIAVARAEDALHAGFPAAALDHLADADPTDPRVAACLGLAWHGSGCVELKGGRIDEAYAHLGLARRHYAAAGELPEFVAQHRALTYVSCNTDEALLDDLCGPCRGHLLGGAGASLRPHLRDALVRLPTDLDWFQECCDHCHGVIWKAFDFARYAFLPDACHAWWLAKYANLEDPHAHPSVGRFISALARVEGEMQFRDQAERLAMAERALAEATRLGQPLLKLEARFWCGNVQRSLARFSDARENLRLSSVDPESPWLLALHPRFLGLLEQFTNNFGAALGLFGTAAQLYLTLDPHLTGKLLSDMGEVHRSLKAYEKALELYRQALGFLDARRDPLAAHAAIPMNLAVTMTLGGDPRGARAALAGCRFDRGSFPLLAAKEILIWGCIAQAEKSHREAVGLFAEASGRLERLHQFLDSALAMTHSVESHYEIGAKPDAIACCVTAAHYFEKAGCPFDTLEAVGQLQALVRSQADTRAVAASARRLARRHGGWLPDPV